MRRLGTAKAFLVLAMLGTAPAGAAAQTLTPLDNTSANSASRLSIDASGALYGMEVDQASQWSVFRLVPYIGRETLASFSGTGYVQTGPAQLPGVTLDADGNIYGTVPFGGSNNAGIAFRLDSGGGLTTLFNFAADGSTGRTPNATLLRDAAGNLFGTTSASATPGQGTFFRFAPDGAGGYSHTVLGTGGALAGEIATDAAGGLYSTSSALDSEGRRSIFRLARNANGSYAPNGTVNYPGAQADTPAGVVIDDQNRLFTLDGSVIRADLNSNLNPTGFLNRGIGDSAATGGLLIDPVGNIFGTTSTTAFRLTPDGHGDYSFTTLADLSGRSVAGLVADEAGNLYGTTVGDNGGTIFVISDAGYGVAPQFTIDVTTPEPASLALLGLAAAMLAATRRRPA